MASNFHQIQLAFAIIGAFTWFILWSRSLTSAREMVVQKAQKQGWDLKRINFSLFGRGPFFFNSQARWSHIVFRITAHLPDGRRHRGYARIFITNPLGALANQVDVIWDDQPDTVHTT
jgi:hypothetical protein